MNAFRIKSLSVLLVCVFLLSSCASVLPDPSQIRTEDERIDARNKCIAMYTAGGAAAGALAGALIGGSWKSAGVGALVGGGFGFLVAWGHCLSLYSTLQSQPVAGYQQTARQVGYNPSQGDVVKVQGFNVTPGTITPGPDGQSGRFLLRHGSRRIQGDEGHRDALREVFRSVEERVDEPRGSRPGDHCSPGPAKGRRQIRHSRRTFLKENTASVSRWPRQEKKTPWKGIWS